MSDDLKPGDRVIDLRALTRSAGLFTGMAASPIAAWFAGWSAGGCLLATVLGAGIGVILGVTAAWVTLRAPAGQTVVARVGAGSLGVAIRASLSGGLIVATSAAVAAFVGFGASAAGVVLLAGFGVAVAVGVLGALM